MQITVEDTLMQEAHLDTLTGEEARLALAVGLFAQERLTLAQGARLAGLDFLAFQRELASREVPIHYGPEEFAEDLAALEQEGR